MHVFLGMGVSRQENVSRQVFWSLCLWLWVRREKTKAKTSSGVHGHRVGNGVEDGLGGLAFPDWMSGEQKLPETE